MHETPRVPEQQNEKLSRRDFLGLDRLRHIINSNELDSTNNVPEHTQPETQSTHQIVDIIQKISEKFIVSRRTVLMLLVVAVSIGATDHMTNGLIRRMLSKVNDGAFWTKLFESIENGTLDDDIHQLLESLDLKKERKFSLGEEQPHLVDTSLPVDYQVFTTAPATGKENNTPQLIAVIDTSTGTAEPYNIETTVLNGERFALAETLLTNEPDAFFMTLPGVHLDQTRVSTLFPAEYRPSEERDRSVEYPKRSAVVVLNTGQLVVMTAAEASMYLNNPNNNTLWRAFEMCLATIDSENLNQDLTKISAEAIISGKDLLLTANHTGALATFYEADGTTKTVVLGTHFAKDNGSTLGSLGSNYGISMLDIVYLCQDLAEKNNYTRFVVSYSDPGAQDNLKLVSPETTVTPAQSELTSDSIEYPFELISGQAIPRQFRTSEKFTTFMRQLIGENLYGTQLMQQQGILVRLR